jgi:hypothetical protein
MRPPKSGEDYAQVEEGVNPRTGTPPAMSHKPAVARVPG